MSGTAITIFTERLREAQGTNRSLLCVGLDPVPARFPPPFGNDAPAIVAFNRAIIDATSDIACCYKPNLGFYMPFGVAGLEALAQVRRDVPAHIPVLLDAKLGDFDVTSTGYATGVFETLGFDAVTVNAFIGHDGLLPFLRYADRGVFVLAKTSNPGSGLLQDRRLQNQDGTTESVSVAVARNAREWNTNGNVGLVVGATYPGQLAEIRAVAPDLPFLIPGVGPQGGDLDAAVRNGLDADGAGILISASRAIIYASDGPDFADAARASAENIRAAIEASRASASRTPSSS